MSEIRIDGERDDVISSATAIAERSLFANVAEREWGGARRSVLLTGGMKYLELWGRDSAAAMPALPASLRQVRRNTLEVFIDHQRPDGLFPRKVAGFGNTERNLRTVLARLRIFLPVSLSIKPEYRTAGYPGRWQLAKWASQRMFHGTAGEPKDTNPLILLSIAEYARDEPDFLTRHEAAVKKGLAYLEQHTRDGLLWQYDHEDWLDVIGRQGHVLYTNALYCASLVALARAFRRRDRGLAKDLVRKARAARERLQEFWDHEHAHFISHRDAKATHRQFTTEGNVLAILTGLADARQRSGILANLERIVTEYGYVPIVAPSYPPSMQSGLRRLALWKYRDGRLLKPWLQMLAAKAAAKDKPELAKSLLTQVARIFVITAAAK